MTRDEAITVVAMIVNGWPGPAWDVDRLEAFTAGIMALPPDLATRAVVRAQQKLQYRPSVAELMEFVAIERRAAAVEREELEVLPLKQPTPLWVERWKRARAHGDKRLLPEQAQGMKALAATSPENYMVYRPPEAPIDDAAVWIQPDEWLDETPAIVSP